MAADKWAGTGQKFAQADGSRKETSFRQGERAHSQADNAAGTAVGGTACRLGTSREQESTWARVGIDRAAHEVPDRGVQLPLVDEDRRFRIHQLLWGCSQELSDGGLVEKKGGPSAPRARGGLPDASRPFESDGRQSGEKFVELRVNETWVIARSAAWTLGCGHRPIKTLGADKDTVLRYHSHGFYDTFRTDPTLLIAQQPDREELGLSLGVDARLAVSTIAREPIKRRDWGRLVFEFLPAPSHGRGQGFESPPLHQIRISAGDRCPRSESHRCLRG